MVLQLRVTHTGTAAYQCWKKEKKKKAHTPHTPQTGKPSCTYNISYGPPKIKEQDSFPTNAKLIPCLPFISYA